MELFYGIELTHRLKYNVSTKKWSKKLFQDDDMVSSYTHQALAFINNIKNGTELKNDLNSGSKTLDVILASVTSNKLGSRQLVKHLNILGLIPCRSSSKGVPNKGLLKFGGKSLIELSIENARQSRHINKVVFSSDGEKLIKNALSAGAEAPFIRPYNMQLILLVHGM